MPNHGNSPAFYTLFFAPKTEPNRGTPNNGFLNRATATQHYNGNSTSTNPIFFKRSERKTPPYNMFFFIYNMLRCTFHLYQYYAILYVSFTAWYSWYWYHITSLPLTFTLGSKAFRSQVLVEAVQEPNKGDWSNSSKYSRYIRVWRLF